jgi:hypothetical protein
MRLGMYNMATEPISTAYFVNTFPQSLYPHVVQGYSSVTFYRENEYTHKNISADGYVVFYAIRVNQRKAGHCFFPEFLVIKLINAKL